MDRVKVYRIEEVSVITHCVVIPVVCRTQCVTAADWYHPKYRHTGTSVVCVLIIIT